MTWLNALPGGQRAIGILSTHQRRNRISAVIGLASLRSGLGEIAAFSNFGDRTKLPPPPNPIALNFQTSVGQPVERPAVQNVLAIAANDYRVYRDRDTADAVVLEIDASRGLEFAEIQVFALAVRTAAAAG